MTATAWRCLGASVVGTSHEAVGVPCEDAHRSFVSGGGFVLVVADGAGSASRGGEGARFVAETVAEAGAVLVTAGLADDDEVRSDQMLQILAAARGALEAHTDGDDLGALATTVAVVLGDGTHLAAAQVGDGAVVLIGSDGTLTQVAKNAEHEFVNETDFLTSERWEQAVAIHVTSDAVRGVAATTDGLVRLATQRPIGEPHAAFFDTLLDYARSADASDGELAEFLTSERVRDATTDDVTLVMAVRL